MNELINRLSKLSIQEDNVFFGHLSIFILTDQLHCLGKYSIPNVITCCPTMFNLYTYTTHGLFMNNEKLQFDHPIKCMKYSHGFVFILTTHGELYLFNDYTKLFYNTNLLNIQMISTCYNHTLILSDQLYVIDYKDYLNIDLKTCQSYNLCCPIIKIAASTRGDLILTNEDLYGIKYGKIWKLAINNVIDISCSDYHDMILTNSALYGFGDNSSGQLGQGDKYDYEGLCKINIPENTSRVYCGRHNTIIYNGNYYGFGDNTNQCLGQGEFLFPRLL